MEIWDKNLILHIDIPWKAAIISMEYGDRKTNTPFWFFALFFRVPWKDAPKRTRILFRNYRREARYYTGRRMSKKEFIAYSLAAKSR
jgi:hypothetical protein